MSSAKEARKREYKPFSGARRPVAGKNPQLSGPAVKTAGRKKK
ncbi:MAG TPA: hypothetical protein VN982_01630 [Candidatus Dormibacteraeota bacterium]|nr:hypothetical protein [Candidatus Dormibacteraeota bacterium]